jgi:ADP-ribose pyrophosphatase
MKFGSGNAMTKQKPSHIATVAQQIQKQDHVKARQNHPAYLAEGVERIAVPDDKVAWNIAWPAYDAIEQAPYTHSAVLNQYEKNGENGWADHPQARTDVEQVQSYASPLPATPTGEALNPGGRTGIKDGRGLLGKAGPNFAADPVIFLIDSEKQELQVLLITRRDTGALAIPGGMVDFGELVSQTLQRELQEETGAEIAMDNALIVYQGYVDDPRNTDKAWMETTVAAKLLEPNTAAKLELQAGDDARAVHLVRVDAALFTSLYASHGAFLRLALQMIADRHHNRLSEVQRQIDDALSQ